MPEMSISLFQTISQQAYAHIRVNWHYPFVFALIIHTSKEILVGWTFLSTPTPWVVLTSIYLFICVRGNMWVYAKYESYMHFNFVKNKRYTKILLFSNVSSLSVNPIDSYREHHYSYTAVVHTTFFIKWIYLP